MTNLNDINEINKLLRQHIITQSELCASQVRNSLSVFGEDLSKLITNKVKKGIDRTDALILFELSNRQDNIDVSVVNDDNIDCYRSYNFQLIIYGNDSCNLANKLYGRLLTDEVLSDLNANGVFVNDITAPVSFNEYINEKMWLRTDITIQLACRHNFEKITNDNNYETLQKITIINNKENNECQT